MNNKTILFKVAQHPLIKMMLKESIVAPSILARLIVEEMIEEAQSPLLKSALAGIRRDMKIGDEAFMKKYVRDGKPVFPYGKLNEMDEEEQDKYKNTVVKNLEAIKQKLSQNSQQQKAGEQLQDKVKQTVDQQLKEPVKKKPKLDIKTPEFKELISRFAAFLVKYDLLKGSVNESMKQFAADTLEDLEKLQDAFKQAVNDKALSADDVKNITIALDQIYADKDLKKQFSQMIKGEIQKAKNHAAKDSSQTGEEPEPSPPPTTDSSTVKPETEPETDEQSVQSEDPKVFDISDEDYEEFQKTAENFIEKFYEQRFLKDQGSMIKNLLSILNKLNKKEEMESAAKRKKTNVSENKSKEIRYVHTGLRTFLKIAKRVKILLKDFHEKAKKGVKVTSSASKKLLERVKQMQEAVADIVKRMKRVISSPQQPTPDVSQARQQVSNTQPSRALLEATGEETMQKWDAIEKGFDEAAKSLKNIMQSHTDKNLQELPNNIENAIKALMSISHYFPSVNPFKTEKPNFESMEDDYENAVKELKPAIQGVLELTSPEKTEIKNAISEFKEFSGKIGGIFGEEGKSSFEDQIPPPPNAPPAEPTSEPTAPPTSLPPEPTAGPQGTTPEPTSTETFSKVFKKQLGYEKFSETIDNPSQKKYQAFMKLMMILKSISLPKQKNESKDKQEFKDSQINTIGKAIAKTIDSRNYPARLPAFKEALKKIKQQNSALYEELLTVIQFQGKLGTLARQITLGNLPEIKEEEYNKIQSFKLPILSQQPDPAPPETEESETKATVEPTNPPVDQKNPRKKRRNQSRANQGRTTKGRRSRSRRKESLEKLIKPLVREMLRKK